MNLHNAAAIVRDDVTTVRVVHTNRMDGKQHNADIDSAKRYDYKVLRSLAAELDKGMIVAVKNGMGYALAIVEEIHDEPQIDLENDKHINYRWAFQIVDTTEVEKREREDERIVKRLRDRQRKNVRYQTLQALGLTATDVQLLLGKDE